MFKNRKERKEFDLFSCLQLKNGPEYLATLTTLPEYVTFKKSLPFPFQGESSGGYTISYCCALLLSQTAGELGVVHSR